MATYRAIHVKMWGDEKFKRLSPPPPSARYLWIYLLAGPHTNKIPGLFTAGEAQLAEALEWPLKGFRERYRELFREGLIEADWRARLVFIPNAIKHNSPDNPNVVKSWKREWEDLPECELKAIAYQYIFDFLKRLGKGFLIPFEEGFPKPSGIYTRTRTSTQSVVGQPAIDLETPAQNGIQPEPTSNGPERRKPFRKPTPEEATGYATEIGFNLVGQHFFDYYEARGWLIGKNPMKDWRAAVRTWKRREEEKQQLALQGGDDWRIARPTTVKP